MLIQRFVNFLNLAPIWSQSRPHLVIDTRPKPNLTIKKTEQQLICNIAFQ